jgi:tRNA threonylcarbamoyladenosine biosynthesis protein TsaB
VLIAGLDCTGESWSVAVARGDEVLSEVVCRQPRTQLRSLTPALRDVCRWAGVSLSSLERIAVTVGPGSFTGVRLGVLVARTLAQALEVEISPVDALEALAFGLPGTVVACGDVRKGEVVTACFRDGRRATPNVLLPGAQWPAWVREQGDCRVVGNALERYGPLPGAAPRSLWWVRAGSVAVLGTAVRPVPWSQLEPAYVRAAEVQIHSSGGT